MTQMANPGGIVSAAPRLLPPSGLEQIIRTFGNIQEYVRADGTLDPKWQADWLSNATLPFPLLLSFDPKQSVTHFACHKLLTGIFESLFSEIKSEGFQPEVMSFGGCFSFRPQRTGEKLSTHSWGIAVDLNPESNVQGTAGNMSPGVIAIFQAAGFEWGGNWPGKSRDAMHFQFCTGY